MKFKIEKYFKENIYDLMRKTGYYFQGKHNADSALSFVRPSSGYPRFHIYLKEGPDFLIFNLHLDQKKPSYKGVKAHSGEYSGPVVEKEAERIKDFLLKL